MQTNDPETRLPLTRSIKLPIALSVAICLLTAAVSLAGLVATAEAYPNEELIRAFLANDVVNLLVGLPILLLSLWLVRTQRLVGLLLWPGALVYTVYNYLVYVLAMPPNAAFVVHLLLVTLGWLALSAVLAAIDLRTVAALLSGRVPARLSGGVLSAFGALFALRALIALIVPMSSGVPLPNADVALNTADLLITPAWLLGGVLLWRRRALGYSAGLALLFQACMLFVGLIVVLLLQPALTGAPLALVDILVVAAMSMVAFVPFIRYLRGIRSVGLPVTPE